MKKTIIILVICIIAILLFTGCKSSQRLAAAPSPIELTAEQLQKFALSEGISWEDLIFIDETSGLVIIGGHVTNTENLRFIIRNGNRLNNDRLSALERLAKQAFTDEKKKIVIYVKQ